MKSVLRKRVGAFVFACLFILGGAAEVLAQYRVRVYNPGRYSHTRTSMSNRAAARAAIRRKKKRQRAHRRALRRTVG